MTQRYCTSCGAELPEDARFCASCGHATHETAAVSTPETDVPVPPPQRDEGATQETPERRGIKRVIKVSRLDKIVGLILAVIIGVPLLLVIMWIVVQFLLGFIQGAMSAV